METRMETQGLSQDMYGFLQDIQKLLKGKASVTWYKRTAAAQGL